MKNNSKYALLLVGLSILIFRLVSVILNLGSMHLSQIHLEFVQYAIPHIQFYVPLIACGIAVFLGKSLARKIVSQKTVFGVIILIVALLPIQVQTVVEPVAVPAMHVEEHQTKPISLRARVIAGEKIIDEFILDNSHIKKAKGVSIYGDTWQIRLELTQEGRRRIREATRKYVGNRIGFFLSGDLKSSHEIMEPLEIPYIMLPIEVSAIEAERLAKGIMKGNRAQQ